MHSHNNPLSILSVRKKERKKERSIKEKEEKRREGKKEKKKKKKKKNFRGREIQNPYILSSSVFYSYNPLSRTK